MLQVLYLPTFNSCKQLLILYNRIKSSSLVIVPSFICDGFFCSTTSQTLRDDSLHCGPQKKTNATVFQPPSAQYLQEPYSCYNSVSRFLFSGLVGRYYLQPQTSAAAHYQECVTTFQSWLILAVEYPHGNTATISLRPDYLFPNHSF